jgi:hypothetical protein
MRFRLGCAVVGAALALVLVLTGTASAAPVSPDLQAQLMALYDRWQASLGQGKLADAAAISVPELSKQITDAMKSKEDAAGLSGMAKAMTPDKIEPRHASMSKDGKQVSIVTLATKKIPADAKAEPDGPKPGSAVQAEITLKFQRDGGAWKFAEQVFGMDPSQMKACHDEAHETLTAYDQGRSQSAGGQIRRVEFKPDHTLVVFRVLDEEDCAILPAKDQIMKGGVDPAALVPYALVEFDGYPHKTDKQRLWAHKFHMLPDE